MRNILPTCERLKEKGMDINHQGCYLCQDPTESIWHLMGDCSFANMVQ